MRKFTRKQKVVATGVAAVATAVAVGGTAYAYWSATGTGSGSASVGSGTNDLTITNVTPTGLVPGGDVTVQGTITNSNPKTSEFVNTVKGTLSIDSTHANAGCLVGDFTLPDVTVNKAVPASNNVKFTATLSMADTGVSQDACKGATVNVAWASN